jgi:hypothetical protein
MGILEVPEGISRPEVRLRGAARTAGKYGVESLCPAWEQPPKRVFYSSERTEHGPSRLAVSITARILDRC